MKPWLLSYQHSLTTQFQLEKLPHAILISGVTASGKVELSHWLVHLLNCKHPQIEVGNEDVLSACGHCKPCLLLKSNTYPDHLNLVPDKNSLGIDEIRDANAFLQKTAHLGQYKTVLIEHAEIMTHAAANALLKTLEEPTDNSVLILLTDDAERLLPTIVSRCRVLHIRPNVGGDLLTSMSVQALNIDANNSTSGNYINLTQLPELTDKNINLAFHQFRSCYIDLLNRQATEAQLLEQLLNNEHALRWLEQITVNLLREQLINVHGNVTMLSTELLNNLYKVIINGCKVMKSYLQANKQFVCEQLIVSISNIIEQDKVNEQEI